MQDLEEILDIAILREARVTVSVSVGAPQISFARGTNFGDLSRAAREELRRQALASPR
jgi:hypothetical protein